MGVTAFLLGAALAGAPQSLAFTNRVQTSSKDVVLGDVASLQALPPKLQEAARQLVLMPAPKWHEVRIVRHSFLASRARSMMPVLSPWLAGSQTGMAEIARGSNPRMDVTTVKLDGIQIVKSEHLRAKVRVGVFTIERDVTALQPASPGGQFFARTESGEVLSVHYGGAE